MLIQVSNGDWFDWNAINYVNENSPDGFIKIWLMDEIVISILDSEWKDILDLVKYSAYALVYSVETRKKLNEEK